MSVVTIKAPNSDSTARIAVEQGFNCFAFAADAGAGSPVDVLYAADGFEKGGQAPSHSGIPLLFPFPNRIRAGRYSWEGKEYQLPSSVVGYDKTGNAIHGFCLDRPWRVTEQSDSSVTGEFRLSRDAADRLSLWPTDAEIRICYSLNRAMLRADITVNNPSQTPLPWGFGTHAYFRVPFSSAGTADNCRVFAPVGRRWELEDCLPTGQVLESPGTTDLRSSPAFSGLKVDDVYTGTEPVDGVVECRICDDGSGLRIVQRCNDAFREIVAFTPPWTSAVCLEPYTCTTDAVNLQQRGIDAGLQVLPPGGSWQGWIEIAVEPLGTDA
ncbi:MAG: aldose 1-epimerase [Planctomycetaceae bacterium]|nr:aldose 1-epimerase [Planctomycetaceae bacterium]